MLSKNDFIENNLIPSNDNCKDISTKLKEFLQQNIPEALNGNGEPDLTKIKNLLGLNSLSGYELKFPGKGIANALYSATIYKELQNENPTNDIAENFIIEGDNLDALKILSKAYTNKIKMIYIDPPYNTGTDDFVYNDNFRSDFDSIAKGCGLIDANGEKTKILKEMESTFKGSKTHSAWLCFMYPRLKLARDLLKDDGVIFISIDDNEQANLKLLCDEIFGEENFVGNIVWHKKDNASFLGSGIIDLIDYILIYQKSNKFEGTKDCSINTNSHRELITKPSKISTRIFNKNFTIIENGKFSGTLKAGRYGSEQFGMEILKDVEIEKGIPKENIMIQGRFCWAQNTIDNEILNGGRIEIKSIKGMKPIFYKKFIDIPFRPMRNLLSKKIEEDIATNNDAAEEIKKLFGGIPIFNYPKPVKLISKFIRNVTNDNDIILDFFAGSGTTAHAVMAQNLADNGNRKFILVQLDEAINEKKNKTSFDFCKNELQSPNPVISNITIERIKRAKKILNSPCNFDVYKIINEPEIDIENDFLGQRNQQNPLNLITNLLLKAGEEIGGKNIQCLIENKLYKVDTNYFVINFVANDEELFNILQADKNGKIFADMYINCDIESWLNFQSKFKERLTIL